MCKYVLIYMCLHTYLKHFRHFPPCKNFNFHPGHPCVSSIFCHLDEWQLNLDPGVLYHVCICIIMREYVYLYVIGFI